MGYRIEYAQRKSSLKAVVSGKSSLERASRIARDIAEEATRQAARQLLIDVRRLADRVGTLRALVVPTTVVPDCAVAVLDVHENDRHYVFSEQAAHRSGRALRLFHDPAAAARWLEGR
jgi:hypothetical protein